MNKNIPENDLILLDYWRVLVRRRKLIGIIVGTAFVLSVIITLLLPKWYQATARILPPQQDNFGGMSPLLAQTPAGMGGLAEGLLGHNSSAEVWAETLKSNTVFDAVIRRFGLMKAYEADAIEDARNTLEERLRISKSKVGVLSISVEDKDPQKAAGLTNAFVEELDNFNRNQVMSTGTKRRLFIEERLRQTKLKLMQDEEALKQFQESSGAVKMDSQADAIIESLGRTKGQLMAKEVELRTLLSYASPNNPRVALLKAEVGELRKELAGLSNGGRPVKGSGDIFIPTSKLPGTSEEHARILRDLKIQEALYALLVSQYEQARIQEAKDSPVVQVMDWAQAPTKRSRPKRTSVVVMATTMASLLAVFLAFVLERLESYRRGNL